MSMETAPVSRSHMKSKKRRERVYDVIFFLLVALLAFLVMFPIWWIFRSSLMTNTEMYAYPPPVIPPVWRWNNYPETLQYFDFWLYFRNTMTIIVPAVLGGVSTAVLCGYAFARLRFPGKGFLFGLCVGSMLLPGMVTLVPLYIMWSRIFHITDSYLPMILPYFTGGGAFNIFLVRQFIRTIPRELDEAAFIDGAGYMRILWSIIVPSIKPAMVVVGLFIFIQLWNDLLQQTVYINSMGKYTIAIGLSVFRGALKSDWAKLMAATCLSFAPGIVIYLLGQKSFVEGIVMTGMKN